MKKTVPFLAAALLSISLFSCTTGKNVTESPKPSTQFQNSETNCFVKFNDGTVKQYASLKLVTGLFKEPHLVANETISIKTETVFAYQSKDVYAVSQRGFAPMVNSQVAKEALPGFAVRIVKGRINVFSVKYYNGHNTTEKLFLQSGEDGEVIPCNKHMLNDIIKETPEAVAVLDSKSVPENKRMQAAVEAYNNSKLISKN